MLGYAEGLVLEEVCRHGHDVHRLGQSAFLKLRETHRHSSVASCVAPCVGMLPEGTARAKGIRTGALHSEARLRIKPRSNSPRTQRSTKEPHKSLRIRTRIRVCTHPFLKRQTPSSGLIRRSTLPGIANLFKKTHANTLKDGIRSRAARDVAHEELWYWVAGSLAGC